MNRGRKLVDSLVPAVLSAVFIKLVANEVELNTVIIIAMAIFAVLYLLFDAIIDNIKLFNLRFLSKVLILSVKGFFGRRDVVENIIRIHRDSVNTTRFGIIYGLGGTGKSALASHFGQMTKLIVNTILVSKTDDLSKIRNIKNNTIVLIDDAYEYAKDKTLCEEIIDTIRVCRNSSKRISIWFLDRTSLKDLVIADFGLTASVKQIDLNTFSNNKEAVLTDIFKYYLKKFPKKTVEKHVNLIKERFDPQFCRPIWAIMMSRLLIDEPKTDFNNYADKEKIINEYWQVLLNRQQFDSFIEDICKDVGRQEDINKLKKQMINRAETLMLFCAITSLRITIDDTEDGRRFGVEPDCDEYHIELLEEFFSKCLSLRDKPIWWHILVKLFPVENSFNSRVIVIQTTTNDLIYSWLLNIMIKEEDKNDTFLSNMLRAVVDIKSNEILAFVSRAAEEDGGLALLWFVTKVYDSSIEIDMNGYEEWLMQWCELYHKLDYGELKKYMVEFINSFIDKMDDKALKRFRNFARFMKFDFISKHKRECIELIDCLEIIDDDSDDKD